MSVRNGLFGPNGLKLPGDAGTFDRFAHDEESLAEATACPISTTGGCCSTQCEAFKARPCGSDQRGRVNQLRYFCELNKPAQAIGVVRPRPAAHTEEIR